MGELLGVIRDKVKGIYYITQSNNQPIRPYGILKHHDDDLLIRPY